MSFRPLANQAGPPPGRNPGQGILFEEIYEQLKSLARCELGRRSEETLNTTALVHELYLKLCATNHLSFEVQAQFFVYAGRAMRHILIDRARHRLTLKLGRGKAPVTLTDALNDSSFVVSSQQALQLDAALTALTAEFPRAAQVVELHFFAGLPLRKVAELLGVVRRTIDRDWRYARSFLISRID